MPTPADSTLASMAPMPDAVTWMNARDGAHSPAAESKELQNVNEVFAPASNGSSSSAEKAVEAEDKTTVQEVIVPDQAFHPAATSSIPKKPLESIPRTEKDMAARNDSSEATSIGPKPAQQIGASIRPPTVEKKVDPVLLMESLNSDDLDITKQSVVVLDKSSELLDAIQQGLRDQSHAHDLVVQHQPERFIEWYAQRLKSKSTLSLVVSDQELGEIEGLELVFCIRAMETALEASPVPIILFVEKPDRARLENESAGLDQLRMVARGSRVDRTAHAQRMVTVIGRVLG